jgi:hypothetical protein
MGTYSLLIGPSQPHLEQEGEKKLEKEGEKKLEKEEKKNKLEEDEEEGEREEQSPKNMLVKTGEKTTGTVTIKIGDRDIKKEEEKSKVKDMDTQLLCEEPETGSGRNESAGESEPEVEEAEGGRSEVRPTCQQLGDIPPAEGGGVQAAAVEILPPEHATPAAVELGKSATTETTAAGPLAVEEIRLAAPTLRQVSE